MMNIKNKKRSILIIIFIFICIMALIAFLSSCIHDTYYPEFRYQIQNNKLLKQKFGEIIKVKETFLKFPIAYKDNYKIDYIITTKDGNQYKIKFIVKKQLKLIIGYEYNSKKFMFPIDKKIENNTIESFNDGIFRLAKEEKEKGYFTYNFINAISNKIIFKNIHKYYISKKEHKIYMIGEDKIKLYMVFDYKNRHSISVSELKLLDEKYIQIFEKKLFKTL